MNLFCALANRIWLLLLPSVTFLAVISDLLFVPLYLNRLLFCWPYAIPCRSIDQYTRLRPLPLVGPCTGRFWLPASQASISFSHPCPLASLWGNSPTPSCLWVWLKLFPLLFLEVDMNGFGPEWLKGIGFLFPPWARWLVPKWGLQQ